MISLHFGQTFHVRVAEWLLACILASWGLMLLRPEITFSTPAYVGLERIFSEVVWGWLCFVCGGLRLTALAINGLWRPSYFIRSITAFLSCFFWMQISLSFGGAGNASTGLAVYPWLLVADIYNVYRATVDGRVAKAAEG